MRIILLTLFFFIGLSACNRNTERMENYSVQGIDVSHYQSTIDWSKVKDQAFDFAFVKATEGMTMVDSIYESNWAQMKAVGLYRGAYHFFIPSLPAKAQAENFISTVNLEVGDLPPVIDIETSRNADKEKIVNGVKTWIKIVEDAFNIKPIIYTNQKFFHKYLSVDFKDHKLWIARYNNTSPELGGAAWSFWQYGDRGIIEGIDGFVDFNVFNGSIDELKALSIPKKPRYSISN